MTKQERALSILLVEDQEINRKIIRLLLERNGHSVTMVENGWDALEVLNEVKFDAILMDVMMPRVDGLETTKMLRDRERSAGRSRTPIIALTALAMKGDRERCLEAGMDDYLSKPVRESELKAALSRVIRGTVSLTTSSKPPVDFERIKSRLGMDDKVLGVLIEGFLTHVPAMLDSLAEVEASGQWDEVRLNSHKLKGLIGYFDEGPMTEMCKNIEVRIREKSGLDTLGQTIERLIRETRRLLEELKAYKA